MLRIDIFPFREQLRNKTLFLKKIKIKLFDYGYMQNISCVPVRLSCIDAGISYNSNEAGQAR